MKKQRAATQAERDFDAEVGARGGKSAVSLSDQQGPILGHFLSAGILLVALFFIWRSFDRMRIETEG